MVEVAPMISLQLDPPLLLACHRTVGVGRPLAAAEKVAVWPAFTVWLTGWVVTSGAKLTVNVAALLVAEPRLLVKTARNCLPESAACAVKP